MSYLAYFAVSATDDTHRTSGSSSNLALPLAWCGFSTYSLLLANTSRMNDAYRQWINLGTILAVFGIMVAYRLRRSHLRTRQQGRKAHGLRIGADIDGVLGNQIAGILPRIKARHGIDLSYDDITDWQLPVGKSSDVKAEIENAMSDPQYILTMPLHAESTTSWKLCSTRNRLSHRDGSAALSEGRYGSVVGEVHFRFDGLINLKEKAKSMFQTDVLVDDYVGNVEEYLGNSPGVAVLVSQPWDRDHTSLANGRTTPGLYMPMISAAGSDLHPELLPAAPIPRDRISLPRHSTQRLTLLGNRQQAPSSLRHQNRRRHWANRRCDVALSPSTR